MSAIQIADNVYSVGVKDPQLKVFDIIMPITQGTTYNAYLVKGEKVALIDTVKAGFLEEYFANIEQVTSLERIEYLIVNHNEPDHSGGITAVLDRVPGIKLICSAPALPFLKNIINREADMTGVKDGFELDLGGKTLRFLGMPYMHWPDTMMDYLVEDKILFSNDGFAAHLSSEGLFDDEISGDLDHQFYYYWDAIMRPFSGYARKNLSKLDGLEIAQIATSHGPILRRDPKAYIAKYKEWSRDKAEGRNKVTVFYASNYGNTQTVAQALSRELAGRGFEIQVADVTATKDEQAKDLIEESLGVVIGTPTFNGDAVEPIWRLTVFFDRPSPRQEGGRVRIIRLGRRGRQAGGGPLGRAEAEGLRGAVPSAAGTLR
jgi:flavorubredoxin